MEQQDYSITFTRPNGGLSELAIPEWRALVEKMKGRGLEGLRIAHVKPNGMDHLEYCEIFAREAGIDARAFSDAGVADRWLRYGVDEASA